MKKYDLLLVLLILILVVGAFNVTNEHSKTKLHPNLSLLQRARKALKEKFKDRSFNNKRCFVCCIQGMALGNNTGYFVPFINYLKADPTLKKLKELKIHEPTFDISGDTSISGQRNEILNGLPNNLSEYDFIVLTGISMGACVSWLLLDSFIKKGFAGKLIIVTFSGPNPKVGVPITLNGEAILAIVAAFRKKDLVTLIMKKILKISPSTIQQLEDLVLNKQKVNLGKYLNKDAGDGIKDLRPNSLVMGEILKIMENLKNIPALAFVGNDQNNGYKKMVPMLQQNFYGLANVLICRYVNKDSIKHIFHLYTLMKEGKWSRLHKSDGLIPKGPSLPIKVIEVPGYHDDHMSEQGNINETVHGIAAEPAVAFISNEIRKNINSEIKT